MSTVNVNEIYVHTKRIKIQIASYLVSVLGCAEIYIQFKINH